MKQQPLVTISVASYNNAKYIIETLDSIYNQTYNPIELIVVDDKSTDNSIEVVEGWLSKHAGRFQNIQFIKHEINQGVCKVANQMVRNATGRYVSIIASDDVMLPEKTRVQVDLLDKTDDTVGMTYSDAYMMFEDGTPRYGWLIQYFRPDLLELPSGYIFNDIIKKGFIPAMSVLIKREVFEHVGYFDENLGYEDWDMWLRISRKYKIIASDYPSVRYRMRRNSLSHSRKNWNKDDLKILQKHLDVPEATDKLKELAVNAYQHKDFDVIKGIKKLKTNIPGLTSLFMTASLRLPFAFYRALQFAGRQLGKKS